MCDRKNVKIEVNEKCIKCGACLEFTDYFAEESNGSIFVKNNGVFAIGAEVLQNICDVCPTGAIGSTVIAGDENKKQKLLQELRDLMDFKYPLPTYADVDFKDCKTTFESSCNLRSAYEYNSESAAERDGQRELKRGLFERMDNVGKHIIHDYQEQILSRILTYEPTARNYAYKVNRKLTAKLSELVTEVQMFCNNGVTLPEDFCLIDISPDFSRYLENRNGPLMTLRQIAESSIIKHMSKNVESPSWYDIFVNTDSMDVYVGVDRHGYGKTKEKYAYNLLEAFLKVKEHYFANVDSAIKEYVENALRNDSLREIYAPIQNVVRAKAKKLYEELQKLSAATSKKTLYDVDVVTYEWMGNCALRRALLFFPDENILQSYGEAYKIYLDIQPDEIIFEKYLDTIPLLEKESLIWAFTYQDRRDSVILTNYRLLLFNEKEEENYEFEVIDKVSFFEKGEEKFLRVHLKDEYIGQRKEIISNISGNCGYNTFCYNLNNFILDRNSEAYKPRNLKFSKIEDIIFSDECIDEALLNTINKNKRSCISYPEITGQECTKIDLLRKTIGVSKDVKIFVAYCTFPKSFDWKAAFAITKKGIRISDGVKVIAMNWNRFACCQIYIEDDKIGLDASKFQVWGEVIHDYYNAIKRVQNMVLTYPRAFGIDIIY